LAQNYTQIQENPDYFIGPDGRKLSKADLPPPQTKRWVARRKAEVVLAVEQGCLDQQEALERYNLTSEEFNSWIRMVQHHGVAGLRTTRIRHYRQKKTLYE